MANTAIDLSKVRSHIRGEAAAVDAVAGALGNGFADIVALIDGAEGKVVTTAVGNSGAIAARMAHILALCGLEAVYLDSNQGLHGSVGAVRGDDVVIVISKGGVTDEVNEFVSLSAAQGATIVAVTADAASTMASMAHYVQTLPPGHADPGGLIGMGSSLAQAAWGDALAVALLSVRGEDMDSVARRHPGGFVGKQARTGAGS